jgi:hypothetical protein
MDVRLQHLHTYFLFPFSIDREAVVEDHQRSWNKHRTWIDGLDDWIAEAGSPFVTALGGWRRAAYTRFDMESPAYQDMVFFHPFVRRVFFDTIGGLPPDYVEDEEQDIYGRGESVSLLRCYALPLPKNGKLHLEAEDVRGRSARVQVTDLRCFCSPTESGFSRSASRQPISLPRTRCGSTRPCARSIRRAAASCGKAVYRTAWRS